jgi:hypothetical protein
MCLSSGMGLTSPFAKQFLFWVIMFLHEQHFRCLKKKIKMEQLIAVGTE